MGTLPLLDAISEKYSDTHLDDVCIIACQHILGTTFSMFKKMFEHGLKPENTFLIGKCYSTNTQTFQRFQGTGAHISQLSNAFNFTRSFDEQFGVYTENFLKETNTAIEGKNFKKIILLDDGGFLITAACKIFKDHSKLILMMVLNTVLHLKKFSSRDHCCSKLF